MWSVAYNKGKAEITAGKRNTCMDTAVTKICAQGG